MNFRSPQARDYHRQPRRGTAVVEVAVCLPILVTVFLGSIEICNAICLKQGATAAAYEAARVASNTGGTLVAAQARAGEVLTARSITGATVQFTPATQEAWIRGSDLVVSVSVPASNLGSLNMFFHEKPVTASITMVKQ